MPKDEAEQRHPTTPPPTSVDGDQEHASQAAADESRYTRAEVDRALPWFAAAWVFGAAFCALTGAAFAPFLLRVLKTDDLTYGLINAVGPATVIFLFIGSYVVERTGRIKRTFIGFVVSHRLMWLGVAAVPYLFPHLPNRWAPGVVGLIIFMSSAAANYGGAGWSVWVASVVPKSLAGRYFAVRLTLGWWSMIVTGLVAAHLIDAYQNAVHVYSAVFAVAAVCGAIDILFHIPIAERPRPAPKDGISFWAILFLPWKNGLFRSFALYSGVAWFSYNMMNTFVSPFCLEGVDRNGLGLGVFATNVFVSTLPMVAMALVGPFWGPAIDRFGPKPVLGVGMFAAVVTAPAWLFFHSGGGPTVAIGPWVLRPDMVWFIPVVQIVGGLTWPAIEQGIFYVQIRGFPEEGRSAYIASYQVVLQVASMLGAFAAGACAAFWLRNLRAIPLLPSWFSHYQMVFFTAFVIRLVGFFALFPRLQLEGSAELHEVAKAVASDARTAVPTLSRGRARRTRPR
jgi:MFS family permease